MENIQPISTKRKDILKAAVCGVVYGAVVLVLTYCLLGPYSSLLRALPLRITELIAALLMLPVIAVGLPFVAGAEWLISHAGLLSYEQMHRNVFDHTLQVILFTLFVLSWAGIFALVRSLTYHMPPERRKVTYLLTAIVIYLCGSLLFYFVLKPWLDMID